MGFKSLGIKMSFEKLLEAPLPCILHWNKNHYVVLYQIKKQASIFHKGRNQEKIKLFISDPGHGLINYNKEEFLKFWIGNNANEKIQEGITLLLDPTPKFYNNEFNKDENQKFNFTFLSKYLFKYKNFILQLCIGLLAASLLQLVVPFLTQSIVDVGINNKDLNFIYLILFAQIALFIGRTGIEIIRSWILLHVSTRINISLISDFFIKLMLLPISYFDVKMTGDLLQRINDHKRIEQILTTSSLNVLFSIVNFMVFSFVLAYYSLQIFSVFILVVFILSGLKFFLKNVKR